MEWYWLHNAEVLFERSTPIVILFTANPTRNAVGLQADLCRKKLANFLRGTHVKVTKQLIGYSHGP